MRQTLPLLVILGFAPAARADEFDSKGVKIHYTAEGKGEPVVLVHGLYGSATTNWKLPGIVDALSQEYRTIALDCRGHGESDKPEEAEAYGEEMVEDVVRLLDHLKIEKAHVVGYSMGGMIALKLAVKYPDRMRSAILGGMGMLRTGSPLERVFEAMGRTGSRVPAACPRGLARLSVTEEEVRAIRAPITVIVGERDPCRRMYVEPLREVRPDIPVRVIPGVGHLNCIAKTEFKEDLKRALEGAVKAGEGK